MMEFRQATDQDTPAIVALLKIALGETMMPKSERYWNWKHFENPFGRSPVLLAFEGGRLIGVRAFMKWRWKVQGQIVSAVRAVDTATHPQHQGKGVFRNLTNALIEKCIDDGEGFVFNTPNKKSKPGYLQMGWVEVGRMPLRVRVKPFGLIHPIARPESRTEEMKKELLDVINNKELVSILEFDRGYWHTDYSPDYLRWRYVNVPVANYGCETVEVDGRIEGLFIYRIKQGRLRELRIVDLFLGDNSPTAGLQKKVAAVASVNGCTIITAAVSDGLAVKSTGWIPAMNLRGPVVTMRELTVKPSDLQPFEKWRPSIGDLELF